MAGTVTSGDTIGVIFLIVTGGSGASFSVNAEGQVGGQFKLTITVSGGDGTATSTNSFAVTTTHNYRLTFDGSNVTLEVNGSVEATLASAAKPDRERITLLQSGKAGVALYYNRLAAWSADGGSDRPGVAVELDRLDPNAAGTDSGFGSEADCAAGTPNWNKWDDWASGAADDDGSYNCGQAVEVQTSAVTTHTPTDNIEGVVVVSWQRANTDSKNLDTDLRIHDGTNNIDKNCPNQDNVGWFSQQRTFRLAADGGAWTQGDVDGLEVGVEHISGATNVHASAICGVLVSVDDDPEAAPPENHRRVGAQVA